MQQRIIGNDFPLIQRAVKWENFNAMYIYISDRRFLWILIQMTWDTCWLGSWNEEQEKELI